MAVKKEIFEDFILKLRENEDFPNEIVDSIEKNWNINDDITKDRILKEIEPKDEHKD